MPGQTPTPLQPRRQAELLARPPVGIAPVQRPPEPEETLIADPRGALSPAQMVDHKLLALLTNSNPGLFIQADGLQEIRRIPREYQAPTPGSRKPDATVG